MKGDMDGPLLLEYFTPPLGKKSHLVETPHRSKKENDRENNRYFSNSL